MHLIEFFCTGSSVPASMAAKVNNSNKTHTKTLAQNGMTKTAARQARKANGTKKYFSNGQQK